MIYYGLKNLGIDSVFVLCIKKEGMLIYEELILEVMVEYMVIVNCILVGMYLKVDFCFVIFYELLILNYLFYDLLYNFNIIFFMKKGEEYGVVIKNGFEMLLL